jgi:dienelactone hydrolase
MRLLAGAALAVVVVVAAASCGGNGSRLSIRVSPISATFDVPFTVDVSGVPAGKPARIIFAGRSRDGHVVRCQAIARADARGDVSLGNFFAYAHMDPAVGWPTRLTITVSSGDSRAATHATRSIRVRADVLTTDERPQNVGFYGEWIRPVRTRRHTAILLFGGSEGGLSQGQLATTLAGHGYPVLELAYFAEPGLPQSLQNIPLEYFDRALRWLARQPEVDPNKIVSFGTSRGGEASLIVASTFPELVHAAVGYVPSAIVVPSPYNGSTPAWTYHGRPVRGDTSKLVPTGWIRVEQINGPIFVVGGDDDGLWPSGYSVRNIKRRMLAHHRHDIAALDYPKAGHEIGQAIPRQVDVAPLNYGVIDSRYGQLYLGGSPHADEAALEDSWPKLLAFLSRVGATR